MDNRSKAASSRVEVGGLFRDLQYSGVGQWDLSEILAAEMVTRGQGSDVNT